MKIITVLFQISFQFKVGITSSGGLPPHLNLWWHRPLDPYSITRTQCVKTLRPRQNGHYFPDDIFECIFLKQNVWIPIKISLKFVHKSPINSISALVQITAWRRPGDKPLFEPMLARLPTHTCICVTRLNGLSNFHHRCFHFSCDIPHES